MPWVPSESVKSVIAAVAGAVPGLELLIVFGSVARGRERATSDLDVAFVGDVDSLDLGARVSLAVGREVDVVDVARASVPLLDAIVRDGVVVFSRDRTDVGRFYARALSILETDRPWYERMQNAWLLRVAERGILGRP